MHGQRVNDVAEAEMGSLAVNHGWAKVLLVNIASIIALSYLSYCLPGLLPGDFVTAMYSNSNVILNERQEEELRAFYSKREGFISYLGRVVTLDLGYSYAFMAPVSRLILEAIPWTLMLAGSAHVLSTLSGFVAGVEAAWRRGSLLDRVFVTVTSIMEGIPEIGSGVTLLFLFAFKLCWFPAAGALTAYSDASLLSLFEDVLRHSVLPFFTLFLTYFSGNFFLARGCMIQTVRARFVETARAKGLSSLRIRYAHAARNALLPLVTRFGLRISFMVTGVLVVEGIFSYPGIGTLLFNAVGRRDLPLIQGIVLLSSFTVLGINAFLELVYAWLDPRVKHAH